MNKLFGLVFAITKADITCEIVWLMFSKYLASNVSQNLILYPS